MRKDRDESLVDRVRYARDQDFACMVRTGEYGTAYDALCAAEGDLVVDLASPLESYEMRAAGGWDPVIDVRRQVKEEQ